MPPQAEEMALKILGKGLLQELPIEVSSFVLRCALPQHVLKEKLEEEARRSADGKCNGQFEFISPLAVVNPPIDRAIAAKGQHQSDESAGQKRSAARDVNRAADDATDAYDNAKNVGRDVDAENAPGNQSCQQRGTYGDVGAKLVEARQSPKKKKRKAVRGPLRPKKKNPGGKNSTTGHQSVDQRSEISAAFTRLRE